MNLQYLRYILSEISNRTGFSKFYDFSYKPTFFEKIENIIVVFAFNFLFLSIIFLFITKLTAANYTIINNDWFNNPFISVKMFPNPGSPLYDAGPVFLFFMMCILAPLWEEVIFRVFPIKFARILEFSVRANEKIVKQLSQRHIMLLFVVVSSIIFGIGHGSIINILFQGISGLFMCYLYIKNGDSYGSTVVYHGLWNFNIVFFLPWLIKHI